MQTLLQDFRYSLRLLLKNPSFTIIAVMTIALGIGANSAIFSVVNAVLLQPLPYKNPQQLMALWGKLPSHGLEKLPASVPEFADYRNRNQVFSSIAAYASLGKNLTGAGEPERLTVTFVTADFFNVLDARPLYGRAILAEEDQPGHDQVVVLSYSLWQRRFAGDTGVIGQRITLDGKSQNVIGIMPASFQFPDTETEIWKPMAFSAEDFSENNRGSHYLSIIARMKPEVHQEQAQADIASIALQMQNEHPDHYEEGSGWGANVVSLHEEIVGDVRLILLVLLSVVGFVLLIACANVANLLLVRAATRQREFAIRSALGAGRWRMIRQLLIESLVLSLTGGLLGILFALWGKDLLLSLSPDNLPRFNEIRVDSVVAGFTFAISLLTGLVFGLAPTLQATKLNLSESLKDSGSKATESKSRRRFRNLLVAGEIALALILLIGAGLLLKSLYRLKQVSLGFDPQNVLTLRLSLPQAKYPQPQQQHSFFDQLIDRVATMPNVKSVGIVNFLPLSDSNNRRNISVEGKPENPINVEFRMCNPEYFRTLGIELRAGRFFDENDRANAPYVTVVNETFARIFLPGEDPLGKRIKMGGQNSPFRWLNIVGVINDLKHMGPESETRPEMYVSYLQPPLPDWNVQTMFLAVRTENDPLSLLSSIRGIVHEIDQDQPIYRIATMPQLLSKKFAPRKFNLLLIGGFSGLALLLAAVGIYGVMSYVVAQRTQEIGIRMALGARASDVLGMVIKQAMKLTGVGVGIGLIASYALTRLIENLLFQVSVTDLTTYLAVPIFLIAVALIACYVPARRAAQTDPMIALRYE